jgi:hypothetical protein
LKDILEEECYRKYEDSGIHLMYKNSSKSETNKNLNADGVIILEIKNKDVIIPKEYNEDVYDKLSVLFEYKEKRKYFETIEQIESEIKKLESGK